MEPCHHLIELLLYLDHGTFQLLIISRGKEPLRMTVWLLASDVAEAHRSVAVLAVKLAANDRIPYRDAAKPELDMAQYVFQRRINLPGAAGVQRGTERFPIPEIVAFVNWQKFRHGGNLFFVHESW